MISREIKSTPRFSIIVPVCHGGKFLKQALATLARISPPSGGFEVLVARTQQTLIDLPVFQPDHAVLRIVDCDGNRSELLNEACAAAKGSAWAFADDDCIFPEDWLVNIERFLDAHPDTAALGGADILAPDGSVFGLALDEVLNSFVGTAGLRRGDSARPGRYYPKLWNMTILADSAKSCALPGPDQRRIFDPEIFVHEDIDLMERITTAGGKVAYAPDVWVGHCRDTNFRSFVTRNVGMAQMCRKLGVHKTAHLGLVALVMGIPLLYLTSLATAIFWPFCLFAIGFYATAVTLTGIAGALNKRHGSLLLLIPVLLIALHSARAIGYISPPFDQKIFNS